MKTKLSTILLFALATVAHAQPTTGQPAAPPTTPPTPPPETSPPDESQPLPVEEPMQPRAVEEPTQPRPVEEPVQEDVIEDVVEVAPFTTRLYGYIDGHYEKSAPVPVRGELGTERESQPGEWDVTNFNVMLQGNLFGKYRFFINLAAPGAGAPTEDKVIGIRNAWVEYPVYRDYLNVRVGKLYRRFGLYNEILDAVPTFIGIEPPEMFDDDHLMLTRTTNAMVHGKVAAGDATISYSVSTGNDERRQAQVPFGADLRVEFEPGVLLGGSFYTSNGYAVPSVGLTDGSPIGGVVNWMDADDFYVYSVFGQIVTKGLTFQLEYTGAKHDAQRNPGAIVQLAEGAGLFEQQLSRFFSDPANPSVDNVIRDVEYNVTAAYVRVGYDFEVQDLHFVPYAQFDYYANRETIASGEFGGDNEAGIADDGRFYKSTLGVVFRPVRYVALKVDGSTHTQKFNGKYETYPELRTSLSLYWELGHAE